MGMTLTLTDATGAEGLQAQFGAFIDTQIAATAADAAAAAASAAAAAASAASIGSGGPVFAAGFAAWFNTLPTSLPGTSGQFWNNGGTLSQS